MSDAEFPRRTAGDLTLPNGDRVWVCTLNSRLFEEADEKARWYAQKEARPFLKGQSDYADVVAEIKAKSQEDQAAYLAQNEFPEMRREVFEKYPIPEKPTQGEDSPEEFGKRVVTWEEECKKADDERQKAFETRYRAEIKKNLDLTARVRQERCCETFYANEWGKAFIKRRERETIYRATRLPDDHTQRYFKSAEAYEDADDAVQEALREFYYKTLDTVKQEEIPT